MTFNIMVVGNNIARKTASLINYAVFFSDFLAKILEIEGKDGEKIFIIRIGEGIYSYLIGKGEADVLIVENLTLFQKYKSFLKEEGKCLILNKENLHNDCCYTFPEEEIMEDKFLRKFMSDKVLMKMIYVSVFLKNLNLFLRDKEALIYGLKSVLTKKISDKKLVKLLNAIQRYI